MSESDASVGRTNAARALMSVRTAEKDAGFFLEHLKPGFHVLDCGCGEGNITLGLARHVAPGTVEAFDPDAVAVSEAQKTAERARVQNVSFEVGDLYDLRFPSESFDGVLAHMVFEHLADRVSALSSLHRVLKVGGVLGLRSPDFDATMWWPESDAFSRFRELITKTRNTLGGEANMGRRLRGEMVEAGFDRVVATPSYENYGTTERVFQFAKFYGSILMEDNHYTRTMIETGWTSRSELDEIAEGLETWATLPGAFVADAVVGVVGWKSKS